MGFAADFHCILLACGQMAPGTRRGIEHSAMWQTRVPLPARSARQALALWGFWDHLCSLRSPGLRGLNTIKQPSSSVGTHTPSLPSLLRRGSGDLVPTKGSLSMTKSQAFIPPTPQPQNKWQNWPGIVDISNTGLPVFSLLFPIRSSRCHINYLNLGEISGAILLRGRVPCQEAGEGVRVGFS